MKFRDVVQAFARRGIPRGIIVVRRTDSTHLLARRIIDEYAIDSLVVPVADILAWQQTAGRGRGGRSWSSPAGGGVYATMIRPLEPARAQILPLLAATALCETVNRYLDDRCRLKWPNDLVVAERKLGGLLIDVLRAGSLAVISFGVNWRDIDVADATSIDGEAPGAVGLNELAVALIESVDRALDRDAAPAAVVERYRELVLHRPGEEIRCRVGDQRLAGIYRGIDDRGFLRLAVDGEERKLVAAEIAPASDPS